MCLLYQCIGNSRFFKGTGGRLFGICGRGTILFIGYIDKSDEFSSERCKADRSKLGCFRTNRERHCSCMSCIGCTDRNGNRYTGIFLWKTESTDDENRIEYAWMSLRRSCDGWRPHGYRCDFGNGKWYVYRIGSLWVFNEGHTEDVCISSNYGFKWCWGYCCDGEFKRK